MTYEYSESQSHEAQDVGDNAGACPPEVIEYRIYPESDFGALFEVPPSNVDT